MKIVKFLRDYTPRAMGEIVELEDKLADFYLNNGIATQNLTEVEKAPCCDDCGKGKDCKDKNKEIKDIEIKEPEIIENSSKKKSKK